MDISCCILSVVVGIYADANVEGGHVDLPSRNAAAPPREGAAVLDSLPTTREKLTSPSATKSPQDWHLSLEGTTHAPIDMGILASLETRFRLRLSMGYGWIPSAYSGLLTGIAASASGNAQVGAILNHTSYQGHTFRVQTGVRPFRSLGLYADFGYARLSLAGSLDLATSGVPSLQGLGGGYQAHTTVDMWLVEVGYQHEFWDSVTMGLSLGVMGTFAAQTSITAKNGAPTSPALDQAAKETDVALRSYGFVPTISLRLGFDLFSLRPVIFAHGPN